MKKKLFQQTAIPFLTAACVFSQVGMAFAAIPNTGNSTPSQAYTQGSWKQEEQGWKHYGNDQKPSTGWIYKESGWYYIDPATGFMKTGWIQDTNGKWFYLESAKDQGGVEGRLHTGWIKDSNNNWYFMNTTPGADFGAMLTGWQWIDRSCYYFGNANGSDLGKLYVNKKTPDGYSVNADGRWINEDGSVRHDKQGIAAAVNADGSPVTSGNSSNSTSSGSDGSGSGSSSSGGSSSGNGGSSNSGNSGNNGSNNNGSSGNNGSDNNGNSGNNGSDNGGNSGNNGSGNNDSDNGGNSGSNTPDKEEPADVSVIDESKTKIMKVDSLGKWLTITFDEGYNADNCLVSVDGQDVTSALTKVTDDGSIAKLPLVGTPGSVKAVSKEDSTKSELVTLSSASDETSVYTGDDYLPEKILGHGAIPVWDYYLTNYDDKGNVRVTPSKTTITLGDVQEAHPSYSPDAELDDSNQGTVTIMFNYNTAEEKEWFDAISSLELVAYNEHRNTINDHLTYTVKTDVPHGNGKVGELLINIGQDNFRTNGRYYVRVCSNAGSSAMASIHVVNKKAPTLLISESAVSGKNLHFTVKDMVYGITVPIERVTLTDPTGDTKELNKIDDWYLIGDLFVIYNDVKAENGRNNLPYNGPYTVTLYSNGFKTISKSFTVSGGEDVSNSGVSTLSVDAVSRATASGSTSGSGDGGSTSTSADLIFDSDLLVNANILNDMGETNDAVTNILDYWDLLSGVDSVFDTGDTSYYTWLHYIDAVSDAETDGTTLTFAEYKTNGTKALNRPYAVKEVLEDGLLGDIQHSDSYGRLDAPEITVESASEGSNLVLKCANKNYLEKVYALYLNGNWEELNPEKYSVDTTAGTITVKASALTVGKVTITIDAYGFKSQTVNVDYNKVIETNLTLTPNYQDDKESFSCNDAGKADCSFTVENSNGDFLTNMTEPVVLINENGNKKSVYHYLYESRDAVYFEISDDKKTISLHNVEPGTYTLEVSASYYDNALRASFTVEKENSETPEQPSETKTPEIANVVYVSGYPSCYRISFFGAVSDITAYLDKIKSIIVNEQTYTYASSSFYFSDNSFIKSRKSNTYGDEPYTCLDLATNGFASSTEIVIQADGYAPITYSVELDSKGQVTNNVTRTAPELTYSSEIERGHDFTVTCDNSDYLNAIESVSMGSSSIKSSVKDIDGQTSLVISGEKLSVADSVKLTLKANGYKDQEISFSVITGTAPSASTVTYREASSWDSAHYRIAFDEEDSIVSRYLSAISSVEVAGNTYAQASLWLSDSKYAVSKNEDNFIAYLDLADNAFTSGGSTTIVIKANGYYDYTFAIDADGNIVGADDEQNTPESLSSTELTEFTVEETPVTINEELSDHISSNLMTVPTDTVSDTESALNSEASVDSDEIADTETDDIDNEISEEDPIEHIADSEEEIVSTETASTEV